MIQCPKCAHQWHDEKRAAGGLALARKMSKRARSMAAARAARARWNSKRKSKTKKKP